MQDQLVISNDVLSVISAIVPVDLEVSIDLFRRDLIGGGEIVELAEWVVEGLKRMVVMGVHTGEVQFYLLTLVLHFQCGDCDDYFQAVETERCEETTISVVNFSPESLQYAVTEDFLLLIMRHLDVPSLVLNAPLRILRTAVFLLLQRQKKCYISIEIQSQRQSPPFLPIIVKDLLEERIVAYLQMQVAIDDSAALLKVDVSEVFDVEAHQSRKIVLYLSLCLLKGLTHQVVAVLALHLAEVLRYFAGIGENQCLLSDVLHSSNNAPGKEAALEQPMK